MKRPHLKTIAACFFFYYYLLFVSYRPAILLSCFWSECLDSFIHGKIFLLIGNLGFCCFDLRGNVRSNASTCASCWCAAAAWWVQPNPLRSRKDSLRRSCCWMLFAAPGFCISTKCAPRPPLTFWRSAGSQMSHGRFPESPGLLAWEDPGKKRETESGRRPHDPSYQLNSMLTWIAKPLLAEEANRKWRDRWK